MGTLRRLFLTACLLTLLFLIPTIGPASADSPTPEPEPYPQPVPTAVVALAPEQPAGAVTTLYFPIIFADYLAPSGELASHWYLMVDDGHIESRGAGIERLYHPFQKYSNNPVLRADKSWEGNIVQLYGTVFPGFRMWYSSLNSELNLAQVLFASSNDGFSWTKPNLPGGPGNALFAGQTANLVSVVYNPADRQKPYKLAIYKNNAFYGYYSKDGITTTSFSENPILNSGSDVGHFYWDAHTGTYRGSFKGSEEIFGVQRRVVRFIESSDFVHWTQFPGYLSADIVDEVVFSGYFPALYGMPVFPMGEQYIGLLWLIKARDQSGQHGQVLVQLASSHDGLNWTREEGNRPAILDIGPSGAWDSGQVYTSIRPVKVDNRLWLYYSGCNREHGSLLQGTTCSIGLARIGLNRLASLTGNGVVITQALYPNGSCLHLNYDGSNGDMRVELLTEADVPIPGYEASNCVLLSSDSQDQVVTWAGGSTLPPGPFKIKFLLDDSALYAFAMID